MTKTRSLRQIRDQVITEDLSDRLRCDRRTGHLQLSVCVDGYVAHVTGVLVIFSFRCVWMAMLPM